MKYESVTFRLEKGDRELLMRLCKVRGRASAVLCAGFFGKRLLGSVIWAVRTVRP